MRPIAFPLLTDLRERFDAILADLEAVAGWQTARVNRPVLILGSLDGVETGIRQLRRAAPLELTELNVGGHTVKLPTLPEILRIKAFLCLERNATRDYLDLAALSAHLGNDASYQALRRMDELYPQRGDNAWAVRTQLVKQLAAPLPYDLDRVDLAEYKGVQPPFDRWSHVAGVCAALSDRLLLGFVDALQADSSRDAQAARLDLEDWRNRRAQGETPPSKPLPGLKP
jgi:hypothetical protein